MQESRPFPVGLKFQPSDEELIESYLHKRVSGTPIPFVEYFVRDCDLYGDHEPSVIWESFGGPLLNKQEDLYFFTQLKPKGSRICRKVSAFGAWQGEKGAEEIVSTKTKLPIGFKKRFRYEGEGSDDHGGWFMYEYTLHPSLLGQDQTTDCVLCQIRKNPHTGKHENQQNGKQKIMGSTKKRKRQQNNFECESEATASAVTMLEPESTYNSDMRMSERHVVPMALAVPDLTQQESQQQIYINNTEYQYDATMPMMRNPGNDNLETSKILGIEYYDVPLAEADETVEVVDIAILQDEDLDDLPDVTYEDFIQICELFPVNEFDSNAMQ